MQMNLKLSTLTATSMATINNAHEYEALNLYSYTSGDNNNHDFNL